MSVFTLPVTGVEVRLRPPTGHEDVLLADARSVDVRLAIALADALARGATGERLDWPSLPWCELDVTLLRLRQMAIGEVVRTDTACSAGACGARIDLAFRIDDFLAHHHPRRSSDVAVEPSGWFRLRERPKGLRADVRFRLPSCNDVASLSEAADDDEGSRALQARCIRPRAIPAVARRRVETLMEAMAPSLQCALAGTCPECGADVAASFDPTAYVLAELRMRAAYVYEEVHLLASRYHWSEEAILALPQSRRSRYAELARAERGGA